MRISISFDMDTCGRCGGTGRMPYSAYGGVCFQCHGKGKCATRAGKAAWKKWNAFKAPRLDVTVADLKVGDVVRTDYVAPNGTRAEWWGRVEEIAESEHQYGFSRRDGVETPLIGRNVKIAGPRPGSSLGGTHTVPATTVFHKRPSAQDMQDFAAAHPRLKGYTITQTEEGK